MDFIFRLPDGRRMALWGEQNQIVRLLSGTVSRNQTVIRTDFLSDLSAVMFQGNIYFVYQTVSGAIVMHVPEEENRLLFVERLENCRFRELTLIGWKDRLYLLYIAWNGIREKYSLKLREVMRKDEAEKSGKDIEELLLDDNVGETESVRVISNGGELAIEMGKRSFWLNMNEDGMIRLRKECSIAVTELTDLRRTNEQQADEWRQKLDAEQRRLDSASRQYKELAELAEKLQQEGKYWRNSYYQEVKKHKRNAGAIKVKRDVLR